MNSNIDPTAPQVADVRAAVRRVGADQPRRVRVAALLAAAAPVAVAFAALAGPVAAAVPVAAPSNATHVGVAFVGDDQCNVAIHSGALNTMKWPLCAGD